MKRSQKSLAESKLLRSTSSTAFSSGSGWSETWEGGKERLIRYKQLFIIFISDNHTIWVSKAWLLSDWKKRSTWVSLWNELYHCCTEFKTYKSLSWLRLPLICRWRSCVPLTAKNSVFWKHLNFFFLEITKKTYFQLFMDMFFPHTGWEGGGLTSSGKWRKLALNSFSEKFNVELFLSVVQSSEAEAKYWWRLKGQLPREGKHLAGLNLAKWCDWSVFVSLIDCDWSIFVSLYRKLEAFVSSCSMQTENIAKGTTDPRVEFWLRK